MLDSFDLKPISFYFHVPEKGMEEEMLFKNLEKELECVAELGVTRATLQSTWGRPEVMTERDLAENLEKAVRFAKIAKSFGITTNMHPHTTTYMMFENEIDYVMQNSDRDLLYFAPDTAHIAAGGGKSVDIIRRYADRVNFTHLKDYSLGDKITEDGWVDSGVPLMTCFKPLGDGAIDFAEIFRILDGVNYDGPLCIEIDKPPVSNLQSAIDNFNYINKLIEDTNK